ncbi:unnamed protein product [Pieris macdunnoughi]|uniref:Uncharacterized protein n=1 Tax=Pieris macdunnoughi TaxID=345717 RepID=A0A821SB99_9NEOP|nr:unnamed protein product [Pieris macdunnoughi]
MPSASGRFRGVARRTRHHSPPPVATRHHSSPLVHLSTENLHVRVTLHIAQSTLASVPAFACPSVLGGFGRWARVGPSRATPGVTLVYGDGTVLAHGLQHVLVASDVLHFHALGTAPQPGASHYRTTLHTLRIVLELYLYWVTFHT